MKAKTQSTPLWRALLVPVVLLALAAPARASRPGAIPPAALTADFSARDRLPQSPEPQSRWYVGRGAKSWGPRAADYPPPVPPAGYDPVQWRRERVAATALRYVGLPYRHHHIPAYDPPGVGLGLDCSNFTSWVYNYGLGIRFTSAIRAQADGPRAPGRRLAADEPFAVGDLLFITTKDGSRVSHVVVWLGEGRIIDSHGQGVAVRRFAGWYRDCFHHARRVIE
ncbi:NlpC/P60 family protein [Solidesulfovibrio sp.]|uniref:C40 family peptidase n=1 Tax=Solidesulfovibrio sp. TaxID=2910990 RepID=UPI0026219FBC|nr:NlpC/P60 family protein [Solidesulfovibrio sp.]